jgi:hypothetical protein
MNLFARKNAALLVFAVASLSALVLAAPLAACAQSGFGPLDPAPPKGLTPDEIITRFAARETEFAQARENYVFRQSVKSDVIDDDNGKILGEYQQITDITFDKDGRRQEHVVFAPPNTLDNGNVMMSPADFDEIEHRLPFVFTNENLPQYDLTYVGRQKVDDLDTYVFQAAPKRLEKNKHYFQGRVWVDQQDFQIVLINGKTVPQDTRPGHEDLQPPFTTYYEQIDGKYWFPTYTKSEGVLHFAAARETLAQDIHLRSIIKYTDYKQFHSSARIIYNGEDITDKHTPDTQAPDQPTAPPK